MSQRESYSIPSGTPYAGYEAQAPKVSYLCGECNSKVQLDKEDKIRCSNCGHRVLYKERTKRMVQFEAR